MEGDMTPVTEDLIQATPEAESAIAGPEPEAGGPFSGEESAPIAETTQTIAERELKAILESLLFVSPEPLSAVRLVAVLGDVTKAEVERTLRSLGQDLDQDGRGIRLVEVAGGYRLVTKQEYASWIKRLDKAKSAAKLSRSALESLAIIAYKQPIVRSEIEEIRGVETSGVVRTLLERKMVRIVGRKEVPGRPIMYGTTKFFLEHFGLNDLSQLPPLREFKELGEAEQALLPMDDALQMTADGSATDDRAKSIEGVCQEALSMNEEESPAEFKADEEVKGYEALTGEPVEQA
jgi:segregation and condensation protein B